MKYDNTFKAIDQILWKEHGYSSELDYMFMQILICGMNMLKMYKKQSFYR